MIFSQNDERGLFSINRKSKRSNLILERLEALIDFDICHDFFSRFYNISNRVYQASRYDRNRVRIL